MRPLILLFDIDGTLISTNGAGRRSMEQAFLREHGSSDACAGISFGGMTDRAILRAGLTALGAAAAPAVIDALITTYIEVLKDEISRAECVIHAGIELALAAAEARERCAIGLGTGNVREGARLKLGRVGIHERFSFGGFGCDHEDRGELLRIGAQRGAAALSVPVESCRVMVIGDTPKDVAAAKVIGAACIAVATGSFSTTELIAAGATHAFRDLTDPAALPLLLAE